jgi:hypothetical protein
MDKDIAKLFTVEILVKEADKEYWVLVQDTLFKDMKKDLKKGDPIWIYAQLWGAAKKQFVILVFRWDE